MIADLSNLVILWLENFVVLLYAVVFLIALLESAVVGSVLPGMVVVVLAGFWAAENLVNVGGIVIFAAAGAVIGDIVSYYLGWRGAVLVKEGNRLLTPRLLAQGQTGLKKHGDKDIFLGRFLGPLRPLIPFVAGRYKMGKVHFIMWSILSALAWAGLSALLVPSHFNSQHRHTAQETSSELFSW